MLREQDILIKTKAEMEAITADANKILDIEKATITRLETEITVLKEEIRLLGEREGALKDSLAEESDAVSA